MNKNFFLLSSASAMLAILLSACKNTESSTKSAEYSEDNPQYRAVAYVTSPASSNWRWIGQDDETVISNVDTRYLTHINFAFASIEPSQFDVTAHGRPLMNGGIASPEAYKSPLDQQYHYKATINAWIEEMGKKVDGTKYLQALVELKNQKPALKVLLSIGGWDSDGFCYMARTPEGRQEFIYSCLDLIDEFHLDGIDLDWEHPSNGGWGAIASCDFCVADARTLVKEFRTVLDSTYPEEPKLLTIASATPWVDSDTFSSLDYMNVMCYDYNPGSDESQASFSFLESLMSSHASMVGATKENKAKINLGIPFYNGGGSDLVPYHQEWEGIVDASPEITRDKMNWVKENGYGGGFYWAYSMDKFEQDVTNPNDSQVKILQRTLYETLNGTVK